MATPPPPPLLLEGQPWRKRTSPKRLTSSTNHTLLGEGQQSEGIGGDRRICPTETKPLRFKDEILFRLMEPRLLQQQKVVRCRFVLLVHPCRPAFQGVHVQSYAGCVEPWSGCLYAVSEGLVKCIA